MSRVESTISFKDRYASDAEFKRQVDDGRKRRESATAHETRKSALALIRGEKHPSKRY